MKYLCLFLSIPFLIFGSTIFEFEKETDAELLEEIHEAYSLHIAEGPSNEYVNYRDWCSMFMNLPSVQEEIVSVVRNIMNFHEGYIRSLGSICKKNPEDPICENTKNELKQFLKDYDCSKISTCFTLFLFGVGSMDVTENQKVLQNIILEYHVKKQIAKDFLAESQQVRMLRLLDHACLADIRAFCLESEDAYLQEVLLFELEEVNRPLDYWNKYRFVPSFLQEASTDVAETTPAVKKLQDAYNSFCTRETQYKEEYQEVFGE
ncbi:MAG: hypothetical protein AAGI90_06135 [Chlamydiota bacterium]